MIRINGFAIEHAVVVFLTILEEDFPRKCY